MYFRMDHPRVEFDDYAPFIPEQMAEELTSIAHDMKGMKVVHLNSTATGGGVAEILQSMVPLMDSLGIETERIVIKPQDDFFRVTKLIHNMLQGAPGSLSDDDWDTYHGAIRDVARTFEQDHLWNDVWFVHDPQLLPLAKLMTREPDSTWVWIGHIDLTSPNMRVMDNLLPLFFHYDRLVFSLDDYVPCQVRDAMPIVIAPPGIDPLNEKNVALDESDAWDIVATMGIDPSRPLVTQVSRFDAWKDPWGVVDAYRLARQDVPGLQLALLGLIQASDDPEAEAMVASVNDYVGDDPDVHLYAYTDLPCSVARVVNAFQTASRVVIQKSTREGFGLTVTEAMWKAKAMIGGNVGGIRLQIQDGVNGYLVDSAQECGARMVQLLRDEDLNTRLGKEARASVSRNYLLPRLTLDYLKAAEPARLRRASCHTANPDLLVLDNRWWGKSLNGPSRRGIDFSRHTVRVFRHPLRLQASKWVNDSSPRACAKAATGDTKSPWSAGILLTPEIKSTSESQESQFRHPATDTCPFPTPCPPATMNVIKPAPAQISNVHRGPLAQNGSLWPNK